MTDLECAYIAGFLDGDGSIIFQIVRRRDYRLGFQIRASVCFYQKRCGSGVLEWLKMRLGNGSIRSRGSMTDYTIVGYRPVRRVLNLIRPYLVVKRAQVEAAFPILDAAESIRGDSDLLAIARAVDRYSALNYSKHRTVTANQVSQHFKKERSIRCHAREPARWTSSDRCG
jgi:hypothetical protein